MDEIRLEATCKRADNLIARLEQRIKEARSRDWTDDELDWLEHRIDDIGAEILAMENKFDGRSD